jgi:palmitoyltransferase
VDYLLNPTPESGSPQRIAAGIALLIVYFFLTVPMAIAYFRLLYVVILNPGLTPQRQPRFEVVPSKVPDAYENTSTTRSCASTTVVDSQEPTNLDFKGILEHRVPAPPGIEDFYTKDVFVCDANGLPLWCPTCCNWKPDRSHHSSDVGRCVLKMDHFCPWVGGVVGENGFKFFVQFCTYANVFTAYVLACMAIFVAEAKQERGGIGNVHWVVVIGLSGFFCFFTFGLNLMSFQLTLKDLTTIENIDAGKRSMFLAVLLPPELQNRPLPSFLPPAAPRTTTPPSRSGDSERPLTSEIDDPSHTSYFTNNDRSSRSRKQSKDDPAASYWQGTIVYPLYLPPDRPPLPAPEPRTFAIMRTPPGMNPWDCGAYYNFRSVFGKYPHDWILPLRYSPCTKHNTNISQYAMGWEFEQLLEDARLVQPPEFIKKASRRGSSVHRKKKKKKRRLDYGWQNGERPDGWAMEKEARRMRRETRAREKRGEV